MKVLGIITEYNPFHNGHQYCMQALKEQTGATHTVIVMSGHFTQRGEPALFDKWTRAHLALLGGADLVVELPAACGVRSADAFAENGVFLLDALSVVDILGFGSECGSLHALKQASEFLCQNDSKLHDMIRAKNDEGKSYPRAREEALRALCPDLDMQLVQSPNNILAIEYLNALTSLHSSIVPATITRRGADHRDANLSGEISSASAIRNALKKSMGYFVSETGCSNEQMRSSFCPHTTETTSPSQDTDPCGFYAEVGSQRNNTPSCTDITNTINMLPREILAAVPPECCPILESATPVFLESFDTILTTILRRMPVQELEQIEGAREGLHLRIKKAANRAATFSQIASLAKSKRYTYTRICRVLIHALLGLDAKTCRLQPQYLRVLSLNSRGAEVLKTAKKAASLPLITKVRPAYDSLSEPARRQLDIDLLATDLYMLASGKPQAGKDFETSPVTLLP